jgi:hypothetical protein
MTRHLFFVALILCTLSAATAVAVADRQTKADDTASTSAKDAAQQEEELATVGKKTTDEICSGCHGLEDVTGRRRTPREWNDLVAEMVDRGAPGTPEEIATIKRYLTRYYGMLAVNSASAQEFSSVLGLSSKDADNVVEYRKAHGRFGDAAALANVPDIDKTKINAQPDALRFD